MNKYSLTWNTRDDKAFLFSITNKEKYEQYKDFDYAIVYNFSGLFYLGGNHAGTEFDLAVTSDSFNQNERF